MVEKTIGLFADVLLGDDITKQLEVIGDALKSMPPMADYMNQRDRKMSAVPVMAAQMDLMNRNIASMTHSMGSTMGRMGKWMPW